MNPTADTAQKLVDSLNLLPHPEGGFYKETYRSTENIKTDCLPTRFIAERVFSTGIYFLLRGFEFSSFHRIKSDEMWHFYEGVPLNIYIIHTSGSLEIIRLGRNIENGEVFQAVVPAGVWFASKPITTDGFSLAGCTVSPGFDFDDFELGNRQSLIDEYPHLEALIIQMTRE